MFDMTLPALLHMEYGETNTPVSEGNHNIKNLINVETCKIKHVYKRKQVLKAKLNNLLHSSEISLAM